MMNMACSGACVQPMACSEERWSAIATRLPAAQTLGHSRGLLGLLQGPWQPPQSPKHYEIWESAKVLAKCKLKYYRISECQGLCRSGQRALHGRSSQACQHDWLQCSLQRSAGC